MLFYVYFLLTDRLFLLSKERTLLALEKEHARIDVLTLALPFYVERDAVKPLPNYC